MRMLGEVQVPADAFIKGNTTFFADMYVVFAEDTQITMDDDDE